VLPVFWSDFALFQCDCSHLLILLQPFADLISGCQLWRKGSDFPLSQLNLINISSFINLLIFDLGWMIRASNSPSLEDKSLENALDYYYYLMIVLIFGNKFINLKPVVPKADHVENLSLTIILWISLSKFLKYLFFRANNFINEQIIWLILQIIPFQTAE